MKTRTKRLLSLLLCSVLFFCILSSAAVAASNNGPTSYDAEESEQPVDGSDYSNPIDAALKGELDGSSTNPEAIAKKNAYFESEADRVNGILKTDIAMLGDLPANGVDVLFISDVSGSMNLFPVNVARNSAYTCSCCNEEHYYCIPARMTRGGEFSSQFLNSSDEPVYFKLSDFKDIPEVGYSLVGVGWDYMPWAQMFAGLKTKYPGLNWYDDLNSRIAAFVNLWNPSNHHYRLTGTDLSGNPIYEKIPLMTVPAGHPAAASYYSPDTVYRQTWGCKDRMLIAREWITTFSKRILNYSTHSHIGLVDFAGNYAKPAKSSGTSGEYPNNFTSSLSDVQTFLSATAGYDNTHYHLGLNAAADFIKQHYNTGSGCNHQLFVVFISDGMPDYSSDSSATQQAEVNVKAAIRSMLTQASAIRANPAILETGKGAEVYAAGICVSPTAAWPSSNSAQTAEFWLKEITGDTTGSNYRNCTSVADFEAFMSGVRDTAADALTAVMKDTLGSAFSFICTPEHPITLYDYYNNDGTPEIYEDLNDLPPYIKVDMDAKTITLDIEQLKIFKRNSTTNLSGMRLDFYTQMSAQALHGGEVGNVSKYPTNTGDATLTYLDADNDEQSSKCRHPM